LGLGVIAGDQATELDRLTVAKESGEIPVGVGVAAGLAEIVEGNAKALEGSPRSAEVLESIGLSGEGTAAIMAPMASNPVKHNFIALPSLLVFVKGEMAEN
jgi:hypothetical protein